MGSMANFAPRPRPWGSPCRRSSRRPVHHRSKSNGSISSASSSSPASRPARAGDGFAPQVSHGDEETSIVGSGSRVGYGRWPAPRLGPGAAAVRRAEDLRPATEPNARSPSPCREFCRSTDRPLETEVGAPPPRPGLMSVQVPVAVAYRPRRPLPPSYRPPMSLYRDRGNRSPRPALLVRQVASGLSGDPLPNVAPRRSSR